MEKEKKVGHVESLAAPTPGAEAKAFTAAAFARAHGLNARELRVKLRAAGFKAPYSLADIEEALNER